MFVRLFWRIWHSPTLTTWGSYFVAVINWIVILPLLLTKFSTAEIALWYLFKIIIDLRSIADIGFSATFIREIAYAFGGADNIGTPVQKGTEELNFAPNWELLKSTYLTMEGVYNRLALIVTAALALLSVIFIRPISQIDSPIKAWIAWGVIVITLGIGIRGNSYASLLQGLNKIALYRRWDTFFGVLVILASLALLIMGYGLLELVIVNQSWILLSYIRNRFLAKKVVANHFQFNYLGKIIPEIYKETWSRTWRSGLGMFMSYGIAQFSGLIYAQLGSTSNVASYLLALRFAQTISTFSGAPFYSKLPFLASIYPQNRKREIVLIASKRMNYSHWVFLICFVIVGVFVPPLLTIIGSNADFVSPLLWSIIGLGFLAERFGAMHLQLYSLTNDIIWHIANGVSGLIALVTTVSLYSFVGIYSFPLGYLLGYLGFYAWYSAKHAYRAFEINFYDYEKKTFLVPLILFTISVVGINLLPINLWTRAILNTISPLLR